MLLIYVVIFIEHFIKLFNRHSKTIKNMIFKIVFVKQLIIAFFVVNELIYFGWMIQKSVECHQNNINLCDAKTYE